MKKAILVSRSSKPAFTHDCDACRFLGRLDGADLYYCPNDGSYVRRFGNEPSEYGSLGDWAPEGSPYALAAKLATRRRPPAEWRSEHVG